MIISSLFFAVSIKAQTWGNNRFFYSLSNSDLQRNFYVNQISLVSVATTPLSSFTISESTSTCYFYTNQSSSSLLGTGPVTITNSANIYTSCPSAGSYAYSIYLNGASATTDTFYMTIVSQRLEWYYAVYNSTTLAQNTLLYSNQTNYRLRLWLADPVNLGTAEAALTALVPSLKSSQVTSAFQSLGAYPVVSYNTLYISIGSASWNSASSYWECQLNTSSGYSGSASITLMDQNVGVLGITINPSSFQLPIQKYSSTGLSAASISSSSSGALNIFSDACSPGIHFATTSLFGLSNLAYTQNSFSSLDTTLNSIYQTASSSSTIKSIASTLGTMSILSENTVSYLNSLGSLVASSGIPSTATLDRMQSPTYCDHRLNKTSWTNSIVVTWSATIAATSVPIYISWNSGALFTLVSVNADITGTGSGGRVYDVTIDHSRATLCALIRDGNGYDRILIIDLSNTANSTLGYSSGSTTSVLNAGIKGATPSLKAFPGGQLLVWGESLNYSPDGGKTLFNVPILSRNPSLPASGLASSEYITDVVGSNSGNFAILTSTNRVFYGKVGNSATLELNAGISTDSNVKLVFDDISNLYVVSASTVAPYLKRRLIPVQNEVTSTRVPAASNPSLTCPYSLWSVSSFTNYTLDIGDSVSVNSYLVSSAATLNSASVSLTNSTVVSQSLSKSYPPENLDVVYIENTTIHVTPHSYTSKGRVDLIIQPKSENLACPSSQSVMEILADCPPSRTLVFYVPHAYAPAPSTITPYHKNRYTNSYTAYQPTSTTSVIPTTTSSSSCADSAFSISAGQWYNRSTNSTGTSDITVPSYCSTYGTPQTVYYGNPYRPSFAIFDNGVFVKTVAADIGILEINGRTTYSFNATASSERCISDPISLKTGHFPSTYRPCYSSPGTLSSSSKEYEVINGTNGNAITWTGGVNGLYLFKAKVLDPTYSYCTLTTNFAVKVVGAPADIGWQLLIVGLVDLIGLTSLIVSYLWYSSSRKGLRTEEFQKEKIRDKIDTKKYDGIRKAGNNNTFPGDIILSLLNGVSSSASAPSVKEELLEPDIASLFGIVNTNNIRLATNSNLAILAREEHVVIQKVKEDGYAALKLSNLNVKCVNENEHNLLNSFSSTLNS